MSTNQKTWTDGEAITTTESNRVARIAATMDDRAWEGLLTPGSVQKKIVPLSEESASVNPRLLTIPGVTAGSVKLLPALLIAGGVALPNHVNMAAKIEASADAAVFGSNSSGSNRYDLVYATISYAVSVTGARKVKDVGTAQVSTQVLNLEKATQVVLTVLPNVSQATPTASMPADPGDGSSYSFPLCYVTLANGYVSGTVITQSQITQLWSGGWLQPQRVMGMRALSFYGGATTEKPTGALPSSRWGSDERCFAHLVLKTATPNSQPGNVLDNSIDWRRRSVWAWIAYLGTGSNQALESSSSRSGGLISTGMSYAFFGTDGLGELALLYPGSGAMRIYCDASGVLRVYRGTLTDATNGDLFSLHLWASDQFVAGM